MVPGRLHGHHFGRHPRRRARERLPGGGRGRGVHEAASGHAELYLALPHGLLRRHAHGPHHQPVLQRHPERGYAAARLPQSGGGHLVQPRGLPHHYHWHQPDSGGAVGAGGCPVLLYSELLPPHVAGAAAPQQHLQISHFRPFVRDLRGGCDHPSLWGHSAVLTTKHGVRGPQRDRVLDAHQRESVARAPFGLIGGAHCVQHRVRLHCEIRSVAGAGGLVFVLCTAVCAVCELHHPCDC
mmetsp:Transcript_64903/g.107707  ORF Transcript_64903/g.107707 Transcript_64903/m.107707 type:complete len:239 (-) Transcript_64903:711-1427(-)